VTAAFGTEALAKSWISPLISPVVFWAERAKAEVSRAAARRPATVVVLHLPSSRCGPLPGGGW
jgi:hypothetical protein